MHIGGSPTSPPRRLTESLAALAVCVVVLLMGGCLGDVVPAESNASNASSSQRPKDAGVKRPDSGAARRAQSPEDRACPDDIARPLATGLSVVEVALYQTIKVPLYAEGEWQTERSAPIIQDKRALVRVFAQSFPEYQPHPVQGVLRIKNGDDVVEIVDERELVVDSTDGDTESTFNFEISGSMLRESTQIAVSLEEPDCEAESGDVADVRIPKSGTKALRAEATGKLRIVVVPMVVDGRLPVLTDEQRANIRAALLAFYPIADVELGEHDPINISASIDSSDQQALTDELLHVLKSQRIADRPDDSVYYLGVFQPGATFRVYCENGCVLGLAPQTTQINPREQYAVAAFFADSRGYETIVHELGHAHGRGHSPCDTGIVPKGIDPNYPRRDGSVGDWGWDFRTGGLVPPTNKDVMGYCNPTWMSAYTYSLIATRSRQVNLKPATQALVQGSAQALVQRDDAATHSWRSVLLRSDGKARWGRALESDAPAGALEPAVVRDAAGHIVAEVQVARTQLTHTAGEFLGIPEPGPSWHALELRDRRIELGAILPPL
ncbi:MAG: hypothetical protein ABW252_02975 [Polyangiales bacterium]